ncbi:MAG: DUF4373 domain-containing protein [Bacteroidaceae bacterium]|nr:DUF4373 domain-containing protein [Bacteroidaceae bacterium]
MKKDQYFPHEANLRQTSEFMHLIEKEGMAGYGIYWGLIEYLRSQDNYIGDLRVLKSLSAQMRTSITRLLRILKNYGLFELTDYTFQSSRLITLMKPLESKRKLMDKRSSNDDETINLRNRRNSLETNTTSVTVKKSKEKKSKENTSSAEEVAAVVAAPLSCKLPWEEYVDELDKEQQWKEIMAMRTGLKMEFFSLYPRIVECFKNHVRALGKERSILSSSDAKQYFCFFLAPGSNTYQRLMAQLKQPSDKDSPYRFEERDPTTGQRSYCGVPIPPDAPPRPNAQAVWNEETHQWNF